MNNLILINIFKLIIELKIIYYSKSNYYLEIYILFMLKIIT